MRQAMLDMLARPYADDSSKGPVTVSLTTAETAVIAKGVQQGEKVVVEGQNQLRPGAKVQPRTAGAKGPADKPEKPEKPAP